MGPLTRRAAWPISRQCRSASGLPGAIWRRSIRATLSDQIGRFAPDAPAEDRRVVYPRDCARVAASTRLCTRPRAGGERVVDKVQAPGPAVKRPTLSISFTEFMRKLHENGSQNDMDRSPWGAL